jgi:hypothetical protein
MVADNLVSLVDVAVSNPLGWRPNGVASDQDTGMEPAHGEGLPPNFSV